MPSNFSYSGYAARFLTLQEIKKGTGITNISKWEVGELDKFTYLFENTKFSIAGNSVWAWWLESARSDTSTYAWNVTGGGRIAGSDLVSRAGDIGVRPAIEVSKKNIEY